MIETTAQIAQFDPFKADITALVARIPDLKVVDAASSQVATEHRQKIKELSSAIETRRKEVTGPLDKQKKAIDKYAREIQAPLEEAAKLLSEQLTSFGLEEERRKKQEAAKLEAARQADLARAAQEDQERAEALAAFGVQPDPIAPAPAQAEVEKTYSTRARELAVPAVKGLRKDWKHEVLDPAQVPREYLVVDEAAVRKAIAGGVRDIPGIRIYQEASIR